MKKLLIILLIAMLTVSCFILTACGSAEEQLSAPDEFKISGNTASWTDNINASGYVLKVGNEEYNVSTNVKKSGIIKDAEGNEVAGTCSLDISSYILNLESGTYEISVKFLGYASLTEFQLGLFNIKEKVYIDSAYSAKLNLILQPNPSGDVNRDGIVNSSDASMLLSFLDKKIKLTEKQLLVADVNEDGNVNQFDYMILVAFNDKRISSIPCDITLADINGDGVIDDSDVTFLSNFITGGGFSGEQLLTADVNLDGKVDKLDLQILKVYTQRVGDVNGDGDITDVDLQLVLNHIKAVEKPENGKLLTGTQLLAADVNLDSEVNELDVQIIKKYVGFVLPCMISWGDVNKNNRTGFDDTELILKHIYNLFGEDEGLTTEQLLSADVNFDDVVDEEDLELLLCGYKVTFNLNYGDNDDYLIQTNSIYNTATIKPKDPIRQGYKFTGWFKEAGCVNGWDFKADFVTKDTVLYAGWEIV